MKRTLSALVICLLALMLFTACTAAPSPVAEAASTPEPQVGLPNPVIEVESYAALLAAQPANMLSDAPEGATGIIYSYIKGEPVISQIQFTLGGNEYTYRAAAAVEAAQTDISGIYETLGKSEQLAVENNVTLGGEYMLRYQQGETKGLATWYYVPTGCQYSLWTPTGCDVSQAIEEVVDALLPISTDAAGNPLSPASSTPLPIMVEGKVTGTVTDIQSNLLVLQLENHNTLQFLLSHINNPEAGIGDIVEITYSGNLLEEPEAVLITIVTPHPAEAETPETAISGTVVQYTSQSVFVKTSSVNIFGFVIDANTVFQGQSTALKTGNHVTVTYTGDLANAPLATVIETTAISPDPDPTPRQDDPEPTDKTLKGTVTNLTSKRVTIYTDTGHSYTFQRDGSTYVTGDYMLEYGCRIRVLYDGYASKGPLARRIDVLAPPDPTPPDPTPYTPTVYTISGVIAMSAGNALVVNGDNGVEYSFLLRAPAVSGDLVVGYRVSVTYRVEEDGSMNATRIVSSTPIVYGPGPDLEDVPIGSGVIVTG